MKILLAEDDPVSKLILETMLKKWGHEVTVCSDGGEAWLRFLSERHSIVVSDWMMPVMDGLEFCRKIRALKQTDYCYFILLTAKSRKDNLEEGMEAGADDYLMKPVDKDDLRFRLTVAGRILDLKSDVKSLQALLPICAWCKSVRNAADLWQSAEEYIARHSSGDLTHAICPACLEKQLQSAATLDPSTGT
ncbi:MAG TPA: response regulator [Blastocatellia bacterium]|nr:response regulator [Blastocatellia bacterium]